MARKLGITAGSSVLLDGAPPGSALAEDLLDGADLPGGVDVRRRVGAGPYDVIVSFCPSLEKLSARWPVLHPRTTPAGALWIAWPKRSSGMPTDLDENRVRDFALAHGRVDVKVCAIDEVWSGLKHVIRIADRRASSS